MVKILADKKVLPLAAGGLLIFGKLSFRGEDGKFWSTERAGPLEGIVCSATFQKEGGVNPTIENFKKGRGNLKKNLGLGNQKRGKDFQK